MSNVIFDEILGKLRSADVSGGTGGTSYIGGDRINIAGGTISFVNSADIVNVTGTSVTLQPDTAYKIYATSQAITLNANPPAAGKWAYEGHLEIFTAGTGYIVTGSNVVLANALEPDSVNNCTVRFHDGVAIISVEDHIAGYIVVNGATSGDGSLYYGITTSTNDYVAFDAALNGSVIPLAGAVADGEKHLVGNGYAETTLTGAVDCGTSKFTVANLALQDVVVNGGTMTLGDAFIPSGSTVAVNGGGLAIEKVSGNGGVIDLGNAGAYIAGNVNASGVAFTGGSGGNGGAGAVLYLTNGNTVISNCEFRNNSAGNNAAIYCGGASASEEFDNCIFTSNTATNTVCIVDLYMSTNSERVYRNCTFAENNVGSNVVTIGVTGASMPFVSGCVFSSNAVSRDIRLTQAGSVIVKDCTFADNKLNLYPESACTFMLAGSNSMQGYCNGSGSVTLTSGAILDLTGNENETPINPGGAITFESGGATVLYSSGAVSGSYMMDNVTLPAGAKLTNTAVVDLSGVTVNISGSVSGAYLSGTRVNARSGCMITDTTFGGNTVVVYSDSTVSDCTFNCFTGVSSGGNPTGATVKASVIVSSGGTLTEPTITSGATLGVNSGGSALLVTSQTGATVNVDEGGYITYKE